MAHIKFNNEEKLYNVALSNYMVDRNVRIKIVFNSINEANTAPIENGFVGINEHNFVEQADFRKMKYIYRQIDDVTFILTENEDDVYVEPIPEIIFKAGTGGVIEGDTKQAVEKYEDLVIPTPNAYENYQFVAWNPEIPTSGDVEKNTTFVAEFEYVPTLEEIRETKIKEFNTLCNQTIEAGQDITLSDGTVMHFDYTQYNQMNMSDGANMALSTKESVPYYDSNNNCYLFKAIDMVTIYATCKGYVTYMLTLDHHLEAMIRRMENKEDIAALTFSEGSLDETTKAEFDAVMAQAQIVSDKYMENAIAVLG